MTRKKFKRTLLLDADGDIRKTEQNTLAYVDGPAGVEQELKTRLKTVRGEDPFNPNYGLRIFEVTGAPPAILEREIRNALTRDDRVASVEDVEIDDEDLGTKREVSVTVQVELVDGTPLELTTGIN